MKHGKTLLALCLALVCLCPAALGESTTFEGTVVPGETVGVTAPFGGAVASFSLRRGSLLSRGDVIARIETTKIYAPDGGTVCGVFGQAGDSVETVTARYGTVLYIAPENKYAISADIEKAYNSSETRYVNIGEAVYLSCATDASHTAQGRITAVNGTGYTVETTGGELVMGETVNIYRTPEMTARQRIGRGTVSRTGEIAVSGGGSILYMHVKDGDTVARGQLLYETVLGDLDGLYATSNEIVSQVGGVIASVGVQAGGSVQKGETLLTVYPRESLQVEIDVTEYDLAHIAQGDTVTLSFNWDETGQTQYQGRVAMISRVSEAADSEATYKGYIDFQPGEEVRLGMTVVVYTQGAEPGGQAGEKGSAQELSQAIGE